MKASTHGEHLIKLTRRRWVNCFLVREDDGLTVVDTATAGVAEEIVDAAREAGAPIVRITVTHGHFDHAGSLDELVKLVPDAEVILPAREARFMRGDRNVTPEEEPAEPETIEIREAARGAREVEPGERIGSLEVVGSRGHTLGHVAFLDTRDRTLIAGDAWIVLGGTSVPNKVNWRFPIPGRATWDPERTLRSARELRALNPARLATGHGRVVEDPGSAMDRALAKAG